jgi:hypothetical protein
MTPTLSPRSSLKVARLALLAATSLCTFANAQHVRIEYWSGPVQTFTGDFASGQPISSLPPIGADITRINAYSVDGLASLGDLTLSGSFVPASTGTPTRPDIIFVLGEGPAPEPGTPLSPAFVNITSIITTTALQPRLMLVGSAAGDATGQWKLGAIDRLRIAGVCAADINLTSPGVALAELEVGSIGTRGTSHFALAATNGSLVFINSQGPVNLTAGRTIAAAAGIEYINAPSINATIIANAFGGNGDLNYIGAEQGDLLGRIQCNNLRRPDGELASNVIFVRGRLGATVVVDGDLYGGVFAGAAPGPLPAVRDMKIGGDMRGVISAAGSIGSLTINGSIRLDDNSFVLPIIQSTQGSLSSLTIGGDVEGDGPFLPNIRANDMGTVRIGGNCRATINRIGAGPVNIKDVIIGGSFTGEINVGLFQQLIIGQDLQAGGSIRLAQGIPSNRTLIIGGSWRGTIQSSHPQGLVGQIITNAAQATFTPWAPAAPLLLPAAAPSPFQRTYFYNTFPAFSAIVGGGCVGEIPFSLRAGDSWPRSNATVLNAPRRIWPADGTLREVVTIALSGPVSQLKSQPLTIHAAQAPFLCSNCGAAPTDITNQFDIVIAPPGRPRELWISPKNTPTGPGTFGTPRNYTVTSNGSGLGCVSPLLVKPAQTLAFSHSFSVGGFDLNIDGKVNSQDVTLFTASPIDFTADGRADHLDLHLITTAAQN